MAYKQYRHWRVDDNLLGEQSTGLKVIVLL